MNIKSVACTLVMITTMVLAGCGGGGGGGGSMTGGGSMPDGGSMMDDDMMMGGGTGPGTSACAIGPVAGSGCSHEGGVSSFTFTINEDGSACIGGICSSGRININNFSAMRNADGTWEITALPGGGGGDQMTDGDGDQMTDDGTMAMTTDMAEAAARNVPNPGTVAQASVTQSSDATNGVTTDSVSATAEYDDNGQINFMVSNGSEWSISDDDTVLARLSGTASGVEFNGIELRKSLAGGTLWVDVYSDVEAPTVESTTEQGEPVRLEDSIGSNISGLTLGEINARMGAGELDGVPGVFSCDRAGGGSCPAFFGTHFDPGGTDWIFTPTGATTVLAIDTDYLNLGLWVYVPNGATTVTDWEYGVFVDGSAPFDDTNLRGVTGSATYRGPAIGLAVDASETEETYWTAEATLNAEFGTSSALGTISGSVRNFVDVDTNAPLPGALSVTLAQAPIGDSNSGFFSGSTAATYQGVGYSDAGEWGGRFFGNGESDGQPGSVAGTFGATTGEGESLIGAFGAHKE